MTSQASLVLVVHHRDGLSEPLEDDTVLCVQLLQLTDCVVHLLTALLLPGEHLNDLLMESRQVCTLLTQLRLGHVLLRFEEVVHFVKIILEFDHRLLNGNINVVLVHHEQLLGCGLLICILAHMRFSFLNVS